MERWSAQHITAARHRAQGRTWPDIAETVGYAVSTVRDYKQIAGFEDLVDHFRQALRSEEVEEHWRTGALEALDGMRDEINSGRRARRKLENAVAAGEVELDYAQSAIDALTGDIVRASKEYLRALGFTASERERRKLQAQREETGEAGDRVHVDGEGLAPTVYIPDNGRVDAEDDADE